ncbi:MAG: immune inhibitor A, partial [Candidatus Cloacimonetes bacterium]|nr:immune inhibitor A [Candidatus Cloacimonadota bacterium]
MKKLILLVTISLLLVSFVFAEQFEISKRLASPKAKANRTEAPFFTEDFESTLTWNHYDGGEAPHMWHLQNNNPLVYQTTGYSWFMGDMDLGTNGGYQNDVYLALDTPSILVPATNATLTFKVNYNVESPAGATAPYTGWDGCNVRVSTDNGATWTVLTPTAPAYNVTSLYSFGFIHGEGAGVAGWGGSSNGWVDASVNMSQYAGQNVKIRFAFASDGAYCTADEATMFGMLVDNIVLGDFNHDFNDGNEQNMTYTSMVPLGGDLWHVEEYAQATSPSHVLVCQNDQNTY